eukprot:1173350-Alexandrium_andersonii.AAC.1
MDGGRISLRHLLATRSANHGGSVKQARWVHVWLTVLRLQRRSMKEYAAPSVYIFQLLEESRLPSRSPNMRS